jgi:hypothetical protein
VLLYQVEQTVNSAYFLDIFPAWNTLGDASKNSVYTSIYRMHSDVVAMPAVVNGPPLNLWTYTIEPPVPSNVTLKFNPNSLAYRMYTMVSDLLNKFMLQKLRSSINFNRQNYFLIRNHAWIFCTVGSSLIFRFPTSCRSARLYHALVKRNCESSLTD